MLGSVLIVAVSMFAGGIFLIFVDKWFDRPENENTRISYRKALIIGLFQIISIIPGISRSAATIIGGMSQKLSRKNAAEFSFFLAVPTMFAASVLKLTENYKLFNGQDIKILLVGNIVSFLVALLAIKTVITFLTNHGFKAFGYYRIIVGLILLVLILLGRNLTVF